MSNQSQFLQTVKREPVARYAALDGLRGLAAIVVLLWHTFLIMSPHLVASGDITLTVYNLLTHTPLKLFIAGTEAVTIFFVLSGFVITLPVLSQKRRFSWLAYYPQRFIRLYIPMAASLFLALGLLLWIPRMIAPVQAQHWLVAANWEKIDWDRFWLMFSVFGHHGFTINNPLWSIYWEILFSLLLPLFVYGALLLKRVWYLGLLGLLAVNAYGYLTHLNAFQYLPLFGLGVVLAVRAQTIFGFISWLLGTGSRARWLGLLLFGMSVLALIGYDIAPRTWGVDVIHWLHALSPIGAIGMVLSAVYTPFFKHLLTTSLAQAFGRISFSLYLVHVPIIVAYAYVLGPNQWLLGAVIGIMTALVIGIIFHLIIERPTHIIARQTAALISAIPRFEFDPAKRSLKRWERHQAKRLRSQDPGYTDAP